MIMKTDFLYFHHSILTCVIFSFNSLPLLVSSQLISHKICGLSALINTRPPLMGWLVDFEKLNFPPLDLLSG